MKVYDCIIIGAGPAGLFCGASISPEKQREILILEKNGSAGKKLLLSGSGRCNITHTGSPADFLKHYNEGAPFMKNAFSAFSNDSLLRFLAESGISVTIMDNGKVFPSSFDSADVLSALLRAAEKARCLIRYNESALDISIGGDMFHVSTGESVYISRRIVIAAGGCSYPQTGSNGDSYRLLRELGHPLTQIRPGLAHFKVKNYLFKDLAGISITSAKCAIIREGRLVAKGAGDILFTHTGLSGPGVLDISRSAESGDLFRFAVIPMTEDEFIDDFILRSRSDGKKTVQVFLKVYALPESLSRAVLKLLSIDSSKHVSEITKGERRSLASALCAMTLVIESKGGWNSAMVTAGGASIRHINSKTMESSLVPGLYIIGEALDIDGASGGYNLQAAFSTGFLAAQAISKTEH